MRGDLGRFFRLLGKHRAYAAGAGVLHVAMVSMWFVEPLFMMTFVDLGLVQSNLNVILVLGGLMIAWTAAAYYVYGVCKYHVARLGEMVLADLRCELFAHVARQSPSFFERWPAGRLVALHGPQIDSLLVLVESAYLLSATALVIVMFLLVCFAIDAELALVLLAAPLLMVGLVLLDGRMRAYKKLAVEAQESLISFLKIRFSHVATIQAFQAEEVETGELRRRSRELVEARVGTEAWSQLICRLSDTLRPLLVCTLMVAGGSRIVRGGDLSLGALVALIEYSRLLLAELGDVFRYVVGARQSEAVLRHVFAVLETPLPEGSDAAVALLRPGRGRVQLRDVWFRYAGQRRHALSGVSLCVLPGEFVALVGPSGSGKSTLLRLLLRFHDPQQGTISVDGQDIRTASLSELRARIGVVAQEPVLFDASVAGNIAYGRPDAPRSEIEAAARVAAAREFIEKLPQGFETLVGEGGVELSGGERHRVALARAVLRGAPILVLDEPTAALDARTEADVMKAVRSVARGRTTLMVAHRLSSVLHADRIFVMDGGRVVQVGTHSGLLADERGLYRRLWEHQLGRSLQTPPRARAVAGRPGPGTAERVESMPGRSGA